MARPPKDVPLTPEPEAQKQQRRKSISQTDIPAFTLDEALRIPRALGDDYAFQPSTPLSVAKAVGMQPNSGPFRTLLGASAAYGLTDGSAWAEKITITPVGRRIIRPTAEGEDLAARREALMKPRVIKGFLTDYDGNRVPREDIARNVLAEKFEIPMSETARVFKQILDGARRLGLLTDIGGFEYVQLDNAGPALMPAPEPAEPEEELQSAAVAEPSTGRAAIDELFRASEGEPATARSEPSEKDRRAGRVYITHGKNEAFVELLTKLLKYGELDAVVSVQKETVSLPVTEKVIGDMRSCGAAIIHVDAERKLTDTDGKEHVFLNENVLIEIGAAVALYGKRFILLVGEGVELPSNLQGLYQVRYTGDKLDAEAAMRLMDSIADIKNHPLP